MAELPMVYNNPPREFLDNNTDQSVLSSSNHVIAFDPIEDKYRKKEDMQRGNLYLEAEAEKAKFLDTTKNFQESVGKHTEISIDKSMYQTWGEVEAVMNQVADKFCKSSGKMAAVRRFFDRLGDNGSTFSAWLGLLPDGEYSSIVCGAFKMIIKATIGVRAIREIVFDALGSIPTMLERAKLYFEMWRSLKLHTHFSKLYTAILEVFRHILIWLKENSFKSAAKAFLKQDGYEKSLTLKLKAVEICAASVREEASICSQYALGSINRNVERQTYQLNGMKFTVEGMKDGVGKLGDSIHDVKLSQSRQEGSLARTENLLNSLYLMCCDNYREFKGGMTPKEGKAITFEVEDSKQGPKINQRKLCRILRYDPEMAESDIQKAIAEGLAFSLPVQERAEYLMASPKFKAWFTARYSQVMLVNGNADDDRLSPMSFACGLLANSLFSCAGPITLSFFCGLHTDSRNNETGARPMLASLICQLLNRYQGFDLSFLVPGQVPELEDHETDTLCNLFVALIQQLPPKKVIFCIIDGISFYENGDKRKDCCKVIAAIADLVEDPEQTQAVFKFLITSPSISRWSTKCLARKDVYNLPEAIELTNQGFDGAGFGRVARKGVEDLEGEVRRDVNAEARWPTSSEEDDEEDDEDEESESESESD